VPFQIVRVLFLHEPHKIVVADLGLHLLVEQARPVKIKLHKKSKPLQNNYLTGLDHYRIGKSNIYNLERY